MPRRVIVKPLEQIDVARMILNARKHLSDREHNNVDKTKNLGYYRRIASLEPKTVKGILCHKCRSIINLGESFAKKSTRGKPYHIACAKQLNLI
jgi:hypothetical protein